VDSLFETGDQEPFEKSDEPTGFVFAGRRELSAAERRIVRWRARQLRGVVLFCGLLFPIVLFAALAFGVFIEETQGLNRLGILLVTLVLFAVLVALVIVAYVFLGESRAVGRDARHGFVERYSGVLVPDDENCRPFAELLRSGLLKSGLSQVQWFEILPRSGFLWQANGVRPRRWTPITAPSSVDVAEAPEYAALAAEWVERLAEEGEAIYVGKRELTREEIRELKRHVRHLVIEPLRIALPVTLWFVTVLVLCVRSGSYPTGWNLVMFIVLGVLTLVSDFLLVDRLREVRPYRADIRLGRVNIIRYPLTEEDSGPGRPELSPPVEALPFSGATWTIEGQPAFWRSVPGSLTV
jgi:hypothetical protein